MQPAWVRHVTLTSYDTTKRGTHRTHKSQLQADTANQDRPTGLILQRLPRVIYHHLIVYVQPSWCFYSTLFLTQQGRSLKLAARAGFAIARSGFELFRLCHGYDVMGIRSCELSEPHFVTRKSHNSDFITDITGIGNGRIRTSVSLHSLL